MKVDEYIAQTLIDISKGVASGYIDGEKAFKKQLVSFETITTVTHEGGGSIQVLSLADLKAGTNIEKTNKISFSVPVFFQAPPAVGVGPNSKEEINP